MRERKRYLLLKAPRSGKLGGRPAGGLQKRVEKALLDFLGILGVAEAGPQFIEKKGFLILSIDHLSLEKVRTALVFAGIKCLGVSGTIEALMSKFSK